jgi:putative transcriptional regulator
VFKIVQNYYATYIGIIFKLYASLKKDLLNNGMIEQHYKGYLLASHPRRQDPVLHRGVLLIMDHDPSGAIGLQINKPFINDITFQTVMQNVGLHCDQDQPLYTGGSESNNRIHVIHSLDWSTSNTTKVTDTIGISHDISVLTAISENEGPDFFRVVAGYTRWTAGHLEGEISGEEPWHATHSWSYMPADIESVFGNDGIDQWKNTISYSSQLQVSSWF